MEGSGSGGREGGRRGTKGEEGREVEEERKRNSADFRREHWCLCVCARVSLVCV
jgi:hypothetical protein